MPSRPPLALVAWDWTEICEEPEEKKVGGWWVPAWVLGLEAAMEGGEGGAAAMESERA